MRQLEPHRDIAGPLRCDVVRAWARAGTRGGAGSATDSRDESAQAELARNPRAKA